MMITSMLTTCRCVLTLFVIVSLSVNILLNNVHTHCFALCHPILTPSSVLIHIQILVLSMETQYDVFLCLDWFCVRQGYLSRKEFIAAQGPLPTTVNEFWRMIWEKNVHTLVMLTRCNEQGRVSITQITTYSHTHWSQMCPEDIQWMETFKKGKENDLLRLTTVY